ncbi:hypothetical protein OROGR_002280 [Orobanche gracilis]
MMYYSILSSCLFALLVQILVMIVQNPFIRSNPLKVKRSINDAKKVCHPRYPDLSESIIHEDLCSHGIKRECLEKMWWHDGGLHETFGLLDCSSMADSLLMIP